MPFSRHLLTHPTGVKLVMEATCIMFDEKPKMVDDPNKMGKKMANYWEPAKKLLNDPSKFLDSLLTFDKDNIADHIIKKIEPYIQVCSQPLNHSIASCMRCLLLGMCV